MTINLNVPDIRELKPRITVFGVGGAGGNAVNNMITAGLQGVEFDPLQPGGDHVVDGVATGPAYAEHGDARLQLANVRDVEIDGHGCLSITRALVRRGRRPRELVEVEGLRKRFIRSPHEAIVRLFQDSRQSLS